MYPEDVDPESGCRLPLPRREQLDDAGQRTYDSLADPKGGTIRGLRGPGGIMLHSPELSRRARPLNRYLRHEAGLGGEPHFSRPSTCSSIQVSHSRCRHSEGARDSSIPKSQRAPPP
jgi:hypothetical protein